MAEKNEDIIDQLLLSKSAKAFALKHAGKIVEGIGWNSGKVRRGRLVGYSGLDDKMIAIEADHTKSKWSTWINVVETDKAAFMCPRSSVKIIDDTELKNTLTSLIRDILND